MSTHRLADFARGSKVNQLDLGQSGATEQDILRLQITMDD